MHGKLKIAVVLAAGAALWLGGSARLAAQPINPQVHKKAYEEAAKTADVVAQVRVIKAVCVAAEGEGKVKSVTLEVSLQVLASDKGPLKKDEVVVVTRKVQLPSGPGPGSYGYMGEIRKFPFVPGVTGQVALSQPKDKKGYVAVAGWVEMPNGNPNAIPRTVGQAITADNPPPEKK
jgi:hypothetical protein